MADNSNTRDAVCVQCGSGFITRQPKATTCSRKCNTAKWRAANPQRLAQLNARAAEHKKAKPKPAKDALPPTKCLDCGVDTQSSKRCRPCESTATNARQNENNAKQNEKNRQRRLLARCADCGGDLPNGGHCARRCTECATSRALDSDRRSRRIRRGVQRALMRDATVERVDPIKVFERDGWRCHLCHTKTDKRLRGTHKARAPELDHIVPLSKGGAHSYLNTACSCRQCNGVKSNTVKGQPSLLALL